MALRSATRYALSPPLCSSCASAALYAVCRCHVIPLAVTLRRVSISFRRRFALTPDAYICRRVRHELIRHHADDDDDAR